MLGLMHDTPSDFDGLQRTAKIRLLLLLRARPRTFSCGRRQAQDTEGFDPFDLMVQGRERASPLSWSSS